MATLNFYNQYFFQKTSRSSAIFLSTLIGMVTTNFVALIQAGERIEDGVKIRRILNHGKLRFQIDQSLLEKHEGGTTPMSHRNGRVATLLSFIRKRKEDRRGNDGPSIYTFT